MRRPGRLDRLLYVPLPDEEGRVDILRRISRKTPIGSTVSLPELARLTPRYSGADLAALLREATLLVLDDFRRASSSNTPNGSASPDHCDSGSGDQWHSSIDESQSDTTTTITTKAADIVVEMNHFIRSLETVRPSVNLAQLEVYEQFHETLGRAKV